MKIKWRNVFVLGILLGIAGLAVAGISQRDAIAAKAEELLSGIKGTVEGSTSDSDLQPVGSATPTTAKQGAISWSPSASTTPANPGEPTLASEESPVVVEDVSWFSTPSPVASPSATLRTGSVEPPTSRVATATPTPAAPPTPVVVLPDCSDSGVKLTSPTVNARVSGPVEIKGTASLEGFDYYKFEFKSLDILNDDWHHVETYHTPVVNGVLGYWNMASLPAGRYLFQLVVVDATGNYPPPCQVAVRK